jgi:hypothetical protein
MHLFKPAGSPRPVSRERRPRGKVGLDIQVPPEFPEKYRDALVRAASQCAVKKHLEAPPNPTRSPG